MSEVKIHHEVRSDPHDGWQLCFQWVTYTLEDGSQENGYRFIWRRPDGTMRPARGQARIPSAANLFDLLQRATTAGWFIAAESAHTLPAELPRASARRSATASPPGAGIVSSLWPLISPCPAAGDLASEVAHR